MTIPKKVLVTGANGYIGSYLGGIIKAHGYHCSGAVRKLGNQISFEPYQDIVAVGNIDGNTDWSELLKDVDYVIHLAGCAHKIGRESKKYISEYKSVNRDATLRLAQQAAEFGIKRFIYISTIGVLGDSSGSVRFDNDSIYNPMNPYAHSKMEAEKSLLLLKNKTDMGLIILRPPLVYGPGAPGNFDRLLKLCAFSRFLPFGELNASKSMISLENLCDLITHCLSIPQPKKNIFVVSDDSNWSTKDLVGFMAKFLNVRVFNLSVPIDVLVFLGMLIGRSDDIRKLNNVLCIDSSDTRENLSWSPCQEPIAGLMNAIEYFKQKR